MIGDMYGKPEAYAEIKGIPQYPQIRGMVYFYAVYMGTVVVAEVYGLPAVTTGNQGGFFGFHIHEGDSCSGDASDPLKNTGEHYNPEKVLHPAHVGDLPPLLSAEGTAWGAVYTRRFHAENVIGKTVVIHDMPDDFRSQPSGNSGRKIACGEIKEWNMEEAPHTNGPREEFPRPDRAS